MRWIVADWDQNKSHIFSELRIALTALGHEVQSIPRVQMDRRQELLCAIRGGDFDVLLTWQRFYPMQRDIISALSESRIQTVFTDFGFQPHYQSVVFDSLGENAVSSWPSKWSKGSVSGVGAEHLEAAVGLMRERSAASRMLALPSTSEFAHLRFPFIFVPLQRPRDSVVRYDSTVHDLGELCRKVLFLARGRFFVVCKTHPLDRDLDLGIPDRVDGSHVVLRESFGAQNEQLCDYLLSRAALVVGVNSNMLFRAIGFGSPVLASGRGWYSGSGVICEVNGLKDLRSLQVPPPDTERQRQYIATCLSRQLHFSDLSNPGKVAAILERIGVPKRAEPLTI